MYFVRVGKPAIKITLIVIQTILHGFYIEIVNFLLYFCKIQYKQRNRKVLKCVKKVGVTKPCENKTKDTKNTKVNMKCAVANCKENDSKKKFCHKQHITFYSFPRDVEQRKVWIKFCKRGNTINPKRERICALHFKKDDFERNLRFEMGFSNRSSAKLKPGAVPTLETINTITNAIKTDKCEHVNPPTTSDINEAQGRESKGFSKRLTTVANSQAPAMKIVNEALTFEEENIPMTIIRKISKTTAELKAPKVPFLETCDIKIEDEEVTVPTIETTAIKKEIETFTYEDSVSPELQQTTVPSIATSAIKIENETNKCKVENSSKRTDIKTDSRERIGFNKRLAPALQRGTAPVTETNGIKLEGETYTGQTVNTPTTTPLNQQDKFNTRHSTDSDNQGELNNFNYPLTASCNSFRWVDNPWPMSSRVVSERRSACRGNDSLSSFHWRLPITLLLCYQLKMYKV